MKYFSEKDREICIEVLSKIAKNNDLIDDDNVLKGLVSKIYKARRKKNKKNKKSDDNNGHLYCYICKKKYTQLHFFYRSLCSQCAEFNYQKRYQTINLSNHIVVVTGGRIKIGYETSLKALRDGAQVIVTTRFPKNAAIKFSDEKDFDNWKSRLKIYSMDLRNIYAIENFCGYLKKEFPYVSILINNAAQTIKRPQAFYRELYEKETQQISKEALVLLENKETTNLQKQQTFLESKVNKLFPRGKTDTDGQPLDLRDKNSWVLRLHQVQNVELFEVNLVNSIAPFILIRNLKKMLLKSPIKKRFIINVSAMEGQFSRETKTSFHPHTNMAKASLNMITRTSAQDFAVNSIYMNSVDTGWITDENPISKRPQGFTPPLDIIDGAARVYDPVVSGINKDPLYGRFFKDYKSVDW
ncbi:SDR family oxidoreductase [Candidatus Uabimicrobium sp. HlEnr_7]|uniref:SDR family oxidoreductase n=1 Tax=Candidatus Uabimicrobium helgolandensis TaxID=3095367 RepID=UPI0035593451